MKFEYDVIYIREGLYEKKYVFQEEIEHSLFSLLNIIGSNGWELVGEVDGEIIVKRAITK